MRQEYKLSYKAERGTTPLYVCNTGHQQCSPLYGWGPGVRDHYLIHYVACGKGTFRRAGQKYAISAGQAFFALPGETIAYTADSNEPWEYYWVGFSGSEAGLMLAQTGFSEDSPVLDFGEDKTPAQLLCDIFDCRGSRECDRTRMTGRTYLFLAYLIERTGHAVVQVGQYALKAAEFARNNYAQGVTVADMAAHVGVSRSWLYKDFVRQFRLSPQRYLLSLRLDRSKALLTHTALSVKETALSSGFDDPLYFSRAFKRETGLSPLEYRRRGMEE